MNSATEFIMKYWFVSMLMICMVIVWGVLFQHSQKQDFQIYANNVIERSGGLTTEAIEKIHDYSEKHFGGRFKIVSEPKKVSIWDEVEYRYSLTITPMFWDLDIITREYTGISSSKVR